MTNLSLNTAQPNPQMPTNILLEKWADIGFVWSGEVAVCELPRLYQLLDTTQHQPNLSIKLTLNKKEGILWLNYDIQGEIYLSCQRCLSAISVDLSKKYTIAIIYHDSQLASIGDAEFVFLDEVCPDARKMLPVKDLLEDELLLSLPLSPRHQECELPVQIDEIDSDEEKQNPFAVLSQLKNQLS